MFILSDQFSSLSSLLIAVVPPPSACPQCSDVARRVRLRLLNNVLMAQRRKKWRKNDAQFAYGEEFVAWQVGERPHSMGLHLQLLGGHFIFSSD